MRFECLAKCVFEDYNLPKITLKGVPHMKTKILEKTVFGIFRVFNSSFGGSRVDFRTPCEVLHILDPTGARGTAFEPVFGPRLCLGFFWEREKLVPSNWFKGKAVSFELPGRTCLGAVCELSGSLELSEALRAQKREPNKIRITPRIHQFGGSKKGGQKVNCVTPLGGPV